jgi:membrane dipeptidase
VKVRPPEQAEAVRELRERLGVSPDSAAELEALPEEQRFQYMRGIRDINERWPPSAVGDFVDHIDHVVDLIGIDHAGISSDFGGGGGIVGWSDALETPNITAELVDRGYTAEEIGQLWSGNLLRVWRDVERVAAE